MWATAAADYAPTGLLGLLVGLVGLFVRSMLQDRGAGFTMASENKERIEQLEQTIEQMRKDLATKSSEKHEYVNRAAIAEGTLKLVKRSYKECTCGKLHFLGPLLDDE